MVNTNRVLEEDRIVAELALLGVDYLSQGFQVTVENLRPGEQLLADLVCQPSSRVRCALIALLLAHPEYSQYALAALRNLRSADRLLFKLFYTAAVVLQQKHALVLREMQRDVFNTLPDLFSEELNLTKSMEPEERLKELGYRHQILTGKITNWSGTYQQAANHFLRRKAMEITWRQ